MAEVIRPFIGCKDAVYTLLDESTDIVGGTPTYGTVYPLPGLMEIGFDTAASLTTLFADDGAQETADTVGEMSISLMIKGLLQADRARLLGHSLANGVMVESTSDNSPYIAIGAKRTLNGGHSEYFWLLKVKLSKPSAQGTTKGASIEFQTPTLEGRVVMLTSNKTYRTRTVTDSAEVSPTTLTNWFTQPVISNSADLGALSAVVAKSTTKATFTFTKVGGGNITLTQSQLTSESLPVFKGTNAAPIAGAYVITNNGTPTVTVTFTPTVAFGAVAVSGSVAPNKVFDQNGVACGQTGAVWTSD
jgi:phi13 family phage major tail protein